MNEIVLAFDTSTEQVALALGRIDQSTVTSVATTDFPAPRAALGCLLPSVRGLLSDAGYDVRDLAAIVVGRGPGSFTGVRIAVATAKGLAHGAGIPLHGVNTLDVIAWRLRAHEGLLGVLGDAMRGEVYPALYRVREGGVERLTPDRVADPDTIVAEWAQLGRPLLLAGNGLGKYEERFRVVGEIAAPELWPVNGEGLLAAYADALARDDVGDGDPGRLLPIYTRLSDAEENERARAHKPGLTPESGVAGPGSGES